MNALFLSHHQFKRGAEDSRGNRFMNRAVRASPNQHFFQRIRIQTNRINLYSSEFLSYDFSVASREISTDARARETGQPSFAPFATS